MRRLPMIVALGALVGMVAGLMTAGPALAGRGPEVGDCASGTVHPACGLLRVPDRV